MLLTIKMQRLQAQKLFSHNLSVLRAPHLRFQSAALSQPHTYKRRRLKKTSQINVTLKWKTTSTIDQKTYCTIWLMSLLLVFSQTCNDKPQKTPHFPFSFMWGRFPSKWFGKLPISVQSMEVVTVLTESHLNRANTSRQGNSSINISLFRCSPQPLKPHLFPMSSWQAKREMLNKRKQKKVGRSFTASFLKHNYAKMVAFPHGEAFLNDSQFPSDRPFSRNPSRRCLVCTVHLTSLSFSELFWLFSASSIARGRTCVLKVR